MQWSVAGDADLPSSRPEFQRSGQGDLKELEIGGGFRQPMAGSGRDCDRGAAAKWLVRSTLGVQGRRAGEYEPEEQFTIVNEGGR
jgi:hypothetical protein